MSAGVSATPSAAEVPRPYTLVAELTYRCPLRCAYCSNPLELQKKADELSTGAWLDALGEAEALGVVQVNLTGGEPLLRDDLVEIVARARALDLYTNLITSGVPLTYERLAALKRAGLDAVQLSLQGAREEDAHRIAKTHFFAHKLEAASWVRELALPFTLNVVLHRENIGQVEELIALGERLGAHRIELANTQYLGWALENRAALLPSGAQVDRARVVARAARERLKGKVEILFVLPDYHADVPRACMGGWAGKYIVIAPDGRVLPCHAAHALPGLTFERVTDAPLGAIWRSSAALNAFRGQSWMPEPCRSCDRRAVDFGGCRCQAFALTGDAAATDPACKLSPLHSIVQRAREAAEGVPAATPPPLRYRLATTR